MINDPVLENDWMVVASLAELRESNPLGVRLLGRDLVIWEDGETIYAWHDLCVHRGTKLSLGRLTETNCLACPYHGWQYDSTGQCVHIPAHPEQVPPDKARATTYLVREKYGLIWVCLGSPANEPVVFEEWEDDAFRQIPSGPYCFEASAPRVIENFLDVAHFPFVHAGSLGDPAHPEISDYEAVVSKKEGVVADEITVWQPDPDGTGEGGTVTYTYRVPRVCVAYFVKRKAERFAALYAVCPMDVGRSRGWILMAMNYGFEVDEGELVAFQDRVTGEDIPIVESQRPELLPLDLQSELHLRSDRTAIAYRRWLRELGVTFGVE